MSNSIALKLKNHHKEKKSFFSKPLFKQSVKSNLPIWLILTLGTAAIFIIINLVVGTKQIFTNIDMNKVKTYVADENMQWLQILGLLEQMGFNLARIQTMSQLDLNSIMNDLIYKIAGVLLPMIYVMIVSNKLIAAQVSDGSMAYVLSTPTNRKKVVRTQYFFLIMSLIAMYVIITLSAYISGAVAYFVTKPTVMKPSTPTFATFTIRTLLYCLGSLVAMFGLSGVCFGSSCLFNKSSRSIAVGGGACVLAFLCCILGLFGSKVFVSVGVGVEAMNIFNYLTIYTLVDTETMSTFAKVVTGVDAGGLTTQAPLDWLWKLGILVAGGGLLSLLGSIYFTKKDLPL